MNEKQKSTVERFLEDLERKALFDAEYKKLSLSEALVEAMNAADVTVRGLAERAGVSPTIIQELRSGKRASITLTTLNRLLDAIGYEVSISPKKF